MRISTICTSHMLLHTMIKPHKMTRESICKYMKVTRNFGHKILGEEMPLGDLSTDRIILVNML